MQEGEEERPGMRLVEIWVPDLNDPAVAQEFRRQSVQVSQGEDEDRILCVLEEI